MNQEDQLTYRLEDERATRAQLDSDYSDVQKLLSFEQRTNSRLRSKLVTLEAEMKRAQSNSAIIIHQQQNNIMELKDRLKQQMAYNIELNDFLKTSEEECEDLRGRCAALRTRNNSLQQKTRPEVEFREDLMELKATLADQKEQIRSMKSEWTPPGISRGGNVLVNSKSATAGVQNQIKQVQTPEEYRTARMSKTVPADGICETRRQQVIPDGRRSDEPSYRDDHYGHHLRFRENSHSRSQSPYLCSRDINVTNYSLKDQGLEQPAESQPKQY